MKKFKLTSETKSWLGHTLFRIEALIDFADVKAGDKGGWVDSEEALDQADKSWIYDNSIVCNNSIACNNSRVDNSIVYNNSRVDNSSVDNSSVDNSIVYNNSRVDNSSVDNSIVDNSSVDRDINSRDSLVTVGLIGSRKGTTTYNIEADRVKCGCFSGTLEEFRNKVANEYELDNKHYREYQCAIKLFEVRKELFNFDDMPSKEIELREVE